MKNMKGKNRKNLCMQAAVALLLLCSAGVGAVHQTSLTPPTVLTTVETTFIQGDVPAITIAVTPATMNYGQTNLAERTFATIGASGEGVSTVLGQANLPTISRFIEIPQGSQPQLVIESVTWETTSLAALDLPSPIAPVQPSLLKVEGASVDFTMDSS